GRFQEGMTPEVSKRLAEITVDPKTVELPKRAAAAPTLPRPAASLAPGVARYAVTMERAGNKMAMEVSTEVKEDSGAWQVTDTMKGPQGEATDRSWLDRSSLAEKKRSIAQGPMSFELAFADGKAKGEMKMGGNARPIDADLGGE